MRQFYDTFPTPLGDFSVALNASGSIIATAFGGLPELRERFTADEVEQDPVRTADARREVTEYFAKKRQTFTVKLAPSGTPFQQSVWAALQRIPIWGDVRPEQSGIASLGQPAQCFLSKLVFGHGVPRAWPCNTALKARFT